MRDLFCGNPVEARTERGAVSEAVADAIAEVEAEGFDEPSGDAPPDTREALDLALAFVGQYTDGGIPESVEGRFDDLLDEFATTAAADKILARIQTARIFAGNATLGELHGFLCHADERRPTCEECDRPRDAARLEQWYAGEFHTEAKARLEIAQALERIIVNADRLRELALPSYLDEIDPPDAERKGTP